MKKNQNVAKNAPKNNDSNTDGQPSPLFSAIALAMSVATIVLTILEKLDNKATLIMLGIAVFALGLNQLAIITDPTRK